MESCVFWQLFPKASKYHCGARPLIVSRVDQRRKMAFGNFVTDKELVILKHDLEAQVHAALLHYTIRNM
jgi:hypothetical protein